MTAPASPPGDGMDAKSLAKLAKAGVAVLRLSSSEWQILSSTRNQGARFSLNFPHLVADQVRPKSLVLISVTGDSSHLFAGVIGSKGATATLDSRVVFDFVHELHPNSLDSALNLVSTSNLKASVAKFKKSRKRLAVLSPKLGQQLVASLVREAANVNSFQSILMQMSPPKRYDNARAMQWDAVKLALKAFGYAEASSINLEGGDTALGSVRLLEDAVIEHDARSIPGWSLVSSDVTGTATFRQGKHHLEVITANKRPLEELFGVDLIYLNKPRGALVMVQYKMMEPQPVRMVMQKAADGVERPVGIHDYLVRIDRQFEDEIARMKKFDQDVDRSGSYRLHPGAFYLKLVKRNGSATGSGIILSLAHLEALVATGGAKGPRDGLRLSYEELDGHYLRSDNFAELVRSGYIGTRGVTTDNLWTLVEASLTGGRAVVAAVQSVVDSSSASAARAG